MIYRVRSAYPKRMGSKGIILKRLFQLLGSLVFVQGKKMGCDLNTNMLKSVMVNMTDSS